MFTELFKRQGLVWVPKFPKLLNFLMSENEVMEGEWLVTGYDHDKDKVVYEQQKKNMIVRDGRKDVLRLVFNVDTPITTGFKYLGVGSGTTAAVVADAALGTEIVGAPARLTVTKVGGGAIDDTIIIQETSGSFDQRAKVEGVYGTADLNGNVFAEYGLFSQQATGGGKLFNRFVPSSSISKTSAISVTCQITVRT